ncbi:hypothetical protein [Rhodovulum sp. 12E13]|uniref:hypothetical protein n=1 Tax=Rhodovulum sp. 12E13 TaxID=2203891 RepID=UPI0018F6A786|nr:hypothetical protein [Rhodovulum sp. 12E13]
MARGRHAVEQEEIVYRPRDGDKPERLTTGPNAPQDARARRKLAEVVQPAARWLLGLARSFWRAKKREREAERDLAEARRAATLVAEQQQAAGLVVPRSVAEMVVSRIWWKFSNGVLRAWRFRPDQAAWSRARGSMG